MWVDFVVGSRLCPEGFSPGPSGIPSSTKPKFPNSNSTWNVQSPLNEFHIYIHIFFFSFFFFHLQGTTGEYWGNEDRLCLTFN